MISLLIVGGSSSTEKRISSRIYEESNENTSSAIESITENMVSAIAVEKVVNILESSDAMSSHAPTSTNLSVVSVEQSFRAAYNTMHEDDEVLLLEKVVMAEAGGYSEDSMIAVANVIFNRVAHRNFPDTIYAVIYQKGQFTTANTKKIPSSTVKAAVHKALNGHDVSQGALYFYAPKYVKNKSTIRWFESMEFLFELDGQRYFK